MNINRLLTPLFSLFTISVLVLAWLEKDEYWYVADHGLGYSFGIIGGSLMLLLLLYPARKYWKPMRSWFKVSHWFRIHMIFGVWGPVFIILHSNYNLGSVNSSVALFSMLLVASSGLVGRFVYQKLHRGLYGELIQLSELDSQYQQCKSMMLEQINLPESCLQTFEQLEAALLQRRVSLTQSILVRKKLNQLFKQVKHFVLQSELEKSEKLRAIGLIRLCIQALKRMARHTFYTRLFAMWHVFHLPVFIMMIITAVVHIYVVHMY